MVGRGAAAVCHVLHGCEGRAVSAQLRSVEGPDESGGGGRAQMGFDAAGNFYPHKDLGEARFDKMLDELLVADEAAQVDRKKELMTGVHSVARA